MNAPVYIFPSANQAAAAKCCDAWRSCGYRVAVALDAPATFSGASALILDAWRGYGDACNRVAAHAHADVMIFGADDILPDPNKRADAIAAEFMERFPDGFGVMQPMGDAWGALAPGAERAAVSPWVGAGFVRRTYGGNGPYWPGYSHLYVDAELWNVAEMAGVLWQRHDLTQYHAHHSRGHGDNLPADKRRRIVKQAAADRALFYQRRAADFPGALETAVAR